LRRELLKSMNISEEPFENRLRSALYAVFLLKVVHSYAEKKSMN